MDVFTHGLLFSPLATAFCATRPAMSMTLGFDVLVQLVMAAMTTAPCVRSKVSPRWVHVTLAWCVGPSSSITATAGALAVVTAASGAGEASCALSDAW